MRPTSGSKGRGASCIAWKRPFEFPILCPIAGTAKNTDHDFLFTETLVDAITSDPGFHGGVYASSADGRQGLMRHAKMWVVMGWSTEFFTQGRPRALGFSSLDDCIIHCMHGSFRVMDPNNLICMAWEWQRGDVSRMTDGHLQEALGRIKAKTLVMPVSEDRCFPPRDGEAEQQMIANSECRPLRSTDGHWALFGADPACLAQVDKHRKDVLAIAV